MPKSFWGKLSIVALILFAIQAILFVVMLYVHALAGLVQFLQATPYTAAFGIIIGVIGLVKEKNKGKTIPIIALLMSAIFISLYFLMLFGYQFGG